MAGRPATSERSGRLRYTAVALLVVLSLLVLFGVSRKSEEISYESYYSSTLVKDVSDMQQRMGPMIAGLHNIQEKEKKKHERKKKNKNGKEDIPDPKDLTNTESVWKFLYKHTDEDLIVGTQSENEESTLDEENLNIITLLIKKVEKERADEWLVQLALWFHSVAVHWPKEVVLTPEAVSTIELLLTNTIDDQTFVSDADMKKMVATNASIASIRGDPESQPPTQVEQQQDQPTSTDSNDADAMKEIEETMKSLLDSDQIEGTVARKRIRRAIQRKISPREWKKLLTFIVGVAEAAPMFNEYLSLWKKTSFNKVEDVVFESSPVKKEEMMQISAQLLSVLEEGCEEFPRTSLLIRAMFLKELSDEEKAEKAAKERGEA